MSRLLLVRPGSSGQVEVVLADEELADGDRRVFRRANQVVMTVRAGDPLVVRDVRHHRDRPVGHSATR